VTEAERKSEGVGGGGNEGGAQRVGRRGKQGRSFTAGTYQGRDK